MYENAKRIIIKPQEPLGHNVSSTVYRFYVNLLKMEIHNDIRHVLP